MWEAFELVAYNFATCYVGEKYLALVELPNEWFLSDNTKKFGEMTFQKTLGGAWIHNTPTNITVAIPPRPFAKAVQKLSERRRPDIALRYAEQEIHMFHIIKKENTSRFFECHKEEFLAAQNRNFFNTEIGNFRKDMTGLLRCRDIVLVSTRLRNLVEDKLTPNEYLEERHSSPMCDNCGEKEFTCICSNCNLAHYCSTTCQKQDFGKHSSFCKDI